MFIQIMHIKKSIKVVHFSSSFEAFPVKRHKMQGCHQAFFRGSSVQVSEAEDKVCIY